MFRLTLFQLLLFWGFFTLGQTPDIITYEEYINLVLAEHPIAKQADLQSQFADVEQLKAKGFIDPKIKMDFNSKDFDEKDYYQLLKSEIEIPTFLGLDIKANYETNEGLFLNPENTTTNKGLYAVGVEMDVLRSWSYNERKAALDQASLYRNMTENERQLLINNLILDASYAYIGWWNAYQKTSIIQENIDLAETYLENTKFATELGDKPAIDTLEAQTLLYDQQVIYQELQIELLKEKLKANNYLWEEGQMVFLSASVYPIDPKVQINPNNIGIDFFESHPEIVSKQLKINQLEIQNKLTKQDLLPQLNLGYFPLIGTGQDSILPADTQISNYKVGASFAMPLFRRKEKANYQKGQLKVQETYLDIQNKQNELFVKWNVQENNINNYNTQLSILEKAQGNYQALLDAEITRYNYGESSVFLVNRRLEKLLGSQIKLQELRRKVYDASVQQLYLENNMIKN